MFVKQRQLVKMKGQKNGGEDGRREGGRRLGGLGWVEEGGRGREEGVSKKRAKYEEKSEGEGVREMRYLK